MRRFILTALLALGFANLAVAQTVTPGPVSQATGPLPLALRQIATASNAPNYQDGSNASSMCRTAHKWSDTGLTAVSTGIPNYWISTSTYAETGSGSAVSGAAWIEWPAGTITQELFGGSTTVAIASGGRAQADITGLPAPTVRGKTFWVWTRVVTTSGAGRVLFSNGSTNSYANGGEGCTFSATGSTTPLTGLTNSTNGTTGFRPDAIIGYTTQEASLVLGDSRNAYGVGDQRDGGSPAVGEINRGLDAGSNAYISIGNTGESMISLINAGTAGRTNTVALSAYTSRIINQLGINDVIGGTSLATIQGYYSTIKGYFSGKPTWLTTKLPVTTSTDSWATTANQTTAASNAVRVTLNNWARGYPAGYAGFFEIADFCESARDSGLWAVTGAANGNTVDGTHASPLCYRAIRDGTTLKVN